MVARKFFNREINELFLTIIPTDLSKNQQNDFISKLEDDLVSERGIIKDVTWEAIAPEAPIARLDLESGIARINLLHPFFANFSQEVKSTLPFKLIATTEILTEAYLIESSIAQETVKAIMERRDELLREVTYSDKRNAPYVAQMIQSTLSNPSGLEEALLYAFRSLGFDAIPIGGKGNPDGFFLINSYQSGACFLRRRKRNSCFSLCWTSPTGFRNKSSPKGKGSRSF